MVSILPPIIKIELIILAIAVILLGIRLRKNQRPIRIKNFVLRQLPALILILVIISLMAWATHQRHHSVFLKPLDAALEWIFAKGELLQNWTATHSRIIIRYSLILILLLSLWILRRNKSRSLPWLAVLFAIAMVTLGWFYLQHNQIENGIFFLALGGIYALYYSIVSTSFHKPPGTFPILKFFIPIALVILLGSILRIYKINIIPFRFDPDESIYGLKAIEVLQGKHPVGAWSNIGWRGLGHLNHSPVYTYTIALFFQVFGPNLVALKLVPVCCGIFSIIITYLIASLLFDKRLGLIAAFFLAVSPIAINYSRCGLLLISTQTVGLLIVYLLLRAVRLRDRRSYFFLGIVLAFAGYMYSPIKQLMMVAGFILLMHIIFQRGFLIKHFSGILLMVVTILLVGILFSLPVIDLIYPEIVDYESVWHRTKTHLYTPTADYVRAIPLIGENFHKLIIALFREPHFNYNPWPQGNLYLNPSLAILGFTGIIISLGKIRKSRYLLLLFFLAVFSLPNLLSRPPVMTRRLLYFMPFLYIFSALPLYHLWRGAVNLAPGWGNRFFATCLVVFFIFLGLFNTSVFFNCRESAGVGENERNFDEQVKKLLGGYYVFIDPGSFYWGKTTIDFFCYEKTAPAKQSRFYRYIRSTDVRNILNTRHTRPIAFVFHPDASGHAAAQLIREKFPQTVIEEIKDTFGYTQAISCCLN